MSVTGVFLLAITNASYEAESRKILGMCFVYGCYMILINNLQKAFVSRVKKMGKLRDNIKKYYNKAKFEIFKIQWLKAKLYISKSNPEDENRLRYFECCKEIIDLED
jgi:hypothetical protein